MKTTKNFFTAGATMLLFVIGLSFITSCIKERDHDLQAADDATYAVWVYNNSIDIANEAASTNLSNLLSGTCGTVTYNPNQVIIDFDTIDCLCNDGRLRRGKIIVDYTGTYKDTNATRTITYEDYYVDLNKINGTQIITGEGHNDLNQPQYRVEVDAQIDVLDTLGALTYKADIMRTWESGSTTVEWSDDIYTLNGSGQGINNLGNNYAFNTLEPLAKPSSLICRYFNQGILEVQPQGRSFRSIDFGSGVTCSSSAIVTIDRKQHNMELK